MPKSDREMLTDTVHELRNAVLPPIIAARRGAATEALDGAVVALQRVSDWADRLKQHVEDTREARETWARQNPAPPGTEQYDIDTVVNVAKLDPEYLARLLVIGGLNGHASVASPLEAHAATAASEGRKADADRMYELARRLRNPGPDSMSAPSALRGTR